MKSILVASVLVLAPICCCCGNWSGGFDQAQLDELLGGNLETIIGEAAQVDLQEVLGTPTATPETTAPAESGGGESPTPQPEGETAATEPSGEAEMPADQPTAESGNAQPTPTDQTQEMVESLLEHAQENSGEPFTFGCDNPTIPMPDDVEGCVSVGRFTTYSTALSEEEVNQMYDAYFTGEGWDHFQPMIQEDVINAWSSDGGFAFLTFGAEQGENGKNLVSIGMVTE